MPDSLDKMKHVILRSNNTGSECELNDSSNKKSNTTDEVTISCFNLGMPKVNKHLLCVQFDIDEEASSQLEEQVSARQLEEFMTKLSACDLNRIKCSVLQQFLDYVSNRST